MATELRYDCETGKTVEVPYAAPLPSAPEPISTDQARSLLEAIAPALGLSQAQIEGLLKPDSLP